MRWTFSARFAAAIAGAICFAQPLAAAPVTPTFSLSSSSILPGQEATLDLQLLLLPEPGFSNPVFVSGLVIFNFGDGTTPQTLSVTPGGTSKTFELGHTYLDPGSFPVSFSAIGTFLADFTNELARPSCSRTAIARIANRKARRHRQLSCRNNPTLAVVVRLPQNWEAKGSEILTVEALVTPLPAALPLFASGAALLGWFARRRRNKNSTGLSSS